MSSALPHVAALRPDHLSLSAPERIAIVRLSHLGDVVAALPVYHGLRAAYPNAQLAWVVQPEFADLLHPLPGLERVVPFDRRGGFLAWPKLWRALRDFAPDLIVDAQGNSKSAAVLLGCGAPRRAGLHRSDWREPFGARVLNDPATPSGLLHAGARMRHLAGHLAEHLDPPLDLATLACDPVVSAAERAAGAEKLGQLLGGSLSGTANGSAPNPVLLHLSPPGDVRAWPSTHFAELARKLAQAGRQVVLLSGPGERETGAELSAALGSGRESAHIGHWVGQRGLRQLAGLFSAAASAGGALVACDSGPMHLAAACGLDVLTLDGPQSAERTGPWPHNRASGHRSIRFSGPLDCAPCLARTCKRPEGPVCMRGITPADVLAALGA